MVRKEGGGLVVHILDPHLISLADTPTKAAGLANFTTRHGHEFGRIQLIIVDGDEVRRIEMTDERTRDRVKGVSTHAHLRQLFELA